MLISCLNVLVIPNLNYFSLFFYFTWSGFFIISWVLAKCLSYSVCSCPVKTSRFILIRWSLRIGLYFGVSNVKLQLDLQNMGLCRETWWWNLHLFTMCLTDLLSDEDIHRPRVSELTQSSPDPITTSGTWQQDPLKSTMWLGTEDGW